MPPSLFRFRGQPRRGRVALTAILAALCAATACAQSAAPPPSVAAYKKLSLAELMNIEVTSVSRRTERLSETASSIQVLTGEELQRAGVTRLTAALRLFSNLQVAQVDGRQWAITARGFNATIANKLLVLMDGRTLYTPLFAGVFWDVQDTFLPDIERIEVISGPGTTQWGSNAVNGVINITSKPAKDTLGGLLFGEIGTEQPVTAGARHGGALAPNLHYRIYAQHKEREGARLPSGGEAGDGWRISQGGFRLDWEPQARDRLTLQGDGYGGRIGQLNLRPIKVSGGNVLGRWTRDLGPGAELSLQGYYDHTSRTVPRSFGQEQKIASLDFQHRFHPRSSHTLVWGVDGRQVDDVFKNGPLVFFVPASVRQRWFGGFGQDEIQVNDAWRLTLGIRFEDTPYTRVELHPDARVAWRLRPDALLWAGVSRAVRTPSRTDRELFTPAAPPYFVAGGPDFVSEKLLAYELGWRAQPSPTFGWSLSTFFHDYDDLRSLEPIDARNVTFVVANGIQGHSYGAEISADWQPRSDWRLRLGYAEIRTHAEAKPGRLDRASARTQPLTPNHQLKLGSQFDFSPRVYLQSTLFHVARLGDHALPDYTELNAKLGWQPVDAAELSLVGTNLLHPRHAEFGAPAARREIERSVSVQVSWKF